MTKFEISNWQGPNSEDSGAVICQVQTMNDAFALVSSTFPTRGMVDDNFHNFFRVVIYDDRPTKTISNQNGVRFSSDQKVDGWIAFVKDQFCSIGVVEAVYVAFDQSKVDVWVLIPERDFGLLRRLVDREMNIVDDFGTIGDLGFVFEFHIVYRCGREERELVPQRAIRLPR